MRKVIGVISLTLFVSVIAVTSVVASQGDVFEQLKSKLVESYNQDTHKDSFQKNKYKSSAEKNIQGIANSTNREQQIQELEDTRKINNSK